MVGEVDARGPNRDANLAFSGRWRVGSVLGLQDGQVAVLGDDDGAHESSYAASCARSYIAGSCEQTMNRSGSSRWYSSARRAWLSRNCFRSNATKFSWARRTSGTGEWPSSV